MNSSLNFSNSARSMAYTLTLFLHFVYCQIVLSSFSILGEQLPLMNPCT